MNDSQRKTPPRRLLPARALPPYSYVTGRWPHPLRDAAGHSHGVEPPPAALPSPAAWRECEAYLWGVDLFNAGYYWEAHESWEAVWHAVGRRGPVASFLKALIKLAAAGVKAREGRAEGVRRHARRAEELLEEVAAEVAAEVGGSVAGGAAEVGKPFCYMGLKLDELLADARALQADPAAVVDTREAAVVVVMPFVLEPAAAGDGEGTMTDV